MVFELVQSERCSALQYSHFARFTITLYDRLIWCFMMITDKRAGFCDESEIRVMFAREKHGTGELYLPVGRYPNFRIKDDTHDCNITLVVFGMFH